MADTRYYVDRMPNPPLLLRRVGYRDESFLRGEWQLTPLIIDYMFGHNDFVDEISEAQARKIAPAAFS